jgi:hypothetical protein
VLRSTFLAAASAALLATAAPAAAQAPHLDVGGGGGGLALEASTRATGSLVISWRGDPARGCAAAGLCDVSGRVVYVASRESDVSITGPAHVSLATEGIAFQTATPVVRVVRGPAADPAGACADPLGVGFVRLEPSRERGGRVRLTADPFESPSGLAFPGRCAGPLPEDVRSAMPSVVVRPRPLLSGRTVLPLGGRRAFAAGPFSGEVVSTLRVVRRSRVVAESPEALGGVEPPSRARRRASLDVVYDIVGVRGSVGFAYAGAPGPFCVPLDACGLIGRYEASDLRAAFGRVEVLADGPAAALRGRRSVAAALRAFRAGRLRVRGTSFGPGLRGRGSVAVAREGTPGVCAEEWTGELGGLVVEQRSGGLRLAIGGGFRESGALVPTRCPRPGPGDLAGGSLVAGRVPLRDVGARRLTVRLAAVPGAGGAFTISTTSEAVLELRRRSVRADVHDEADW